MEMTSVQVGDSIKIWLDKASTAQSISAKKNQEDWKKLIYNMSGQEDTNIPVGIRDMVDDAVTNIAKLDDNHFETILAQL